MPVVLTLHASVATGTCATIYNVHAWISSARQVVGEVKFGSLSSAP
jgi:hypothetical protein